MTPAVQTSRCMCSLLLNVVHRLLHRYEIFGYISVQVSWNSFTTSWRTSSSMLSSRPSVSRTWGKWGTPCCSACWASRAWYGSQIERITLNFTHSGCDSSVFSCLSYAHVSVLTFTASLSQSQEEVCDLLHAAPFQNILPRVHVKGKHVREHTASLQMERCAWCFESRDKAGVSERVRTACCPSTSDGKRVSTFQMETLEGRVKRRQSFREVKHCNHVNKRIVADISDSLSCKASIAFHSLIEIEKSCVTNGNKESKRQTLLTLVFLSVNEFHFKSMAVPSLLLWLYLLCYRVVLLSVWIHALCRVLKNPHNGTETVTPWHTNRRKQCFWTFQLQIKTNSVL